MKEIKLALLGFGNAGQAFAKLLLEKNDEIINTLVSRVSIISSFFSNSSFAKACPAFPNPSSANFISFIFVKSFRFQTSVTCCKNPSQPEWFDLFHFEY